MQSFSGIVASRPAPFVRSDLTFDIAAIRAAAKSRYADKLPSIDRYSGNARRYWQIANARRVIRETWADAHEQRHRLVLNRMPAATPYTQLERNQLDALTARMSVAPVTAQGNADFKEAASQVSQINNAAHRRAYLAVIADAGRAA